MLKNTDQTTLKIADLVAPVVSSRDVVHRLASEIKRATTSRVVLDFSNTEFISRSAAHELLTIQRTLASSLFRKRHLEFANPNSSVQEMLRKVEASRSSKIDSKPDFKAERDNINSLLVETR